MPFTVERIAALATVLGTALGVLALIRSSEWLVLVCLASVCISLGAVLYARQKRLILNSSAVVIEGHSIDSLNIANLRRRITKTLVVQEAKHTVRIEGEDMEITWQYSGFCKADGVSSIEFSVDSDENTPFDQLDCVAFDLARDSQMRHRIRPILVGAEGISKKISVPLLEPLQANQPFSVSLKCTLRRCVKAGFGYYTSTSSLVQNRVQRWVVRLIFPGAMPAWVRVYETSADGQSRLVKTLVPDIQESYSSEYVDVVDHRHGQSARIYAFWRDSI
jgi:hypothetical protein